MSTWDPLKVLKDLRSGEEFVDYVDALRLLELAGFKQTGQDGRERRFEHEHTRERAFLIVSMPVPPEIGPIVARKVENYWPPLGSEAITEEGGSHGGQ